MGLQVEFAAAAMAVVITGPTPSTAAIFQFRNSVFRLHDGFWRPVTQCEMKTSHAQHRGRL
jgi:hypothetical protein